MTEQYQVTLDSQMGPRKGLLILTHKGNYIDGSLELVGYTNPIQGIQMDDGTLRLFHSIKTTVSTIICETVLQLHEGFLSGTSVSQNAQMRWKGTLERNAAELGRN